MSQPTTPTKSEGTGSPAMSPVNKNLQFLIPSPLPCRRNRTYSASEQARTSPELYGQMKEFCRDKGHGFVIPKDGGSLLFVHISDIEGDCVPEAGDDVTYKKCRIPPKNEKFCAINVRLVHLKEGVPHHNWDNSPARTESS